MDLPSLLCKGSIKQSDSIDAAYFSSIDKMRAIDYILKFIDRRTAARGARIPEPPIGLGSKIIILRSGTGSGKSTAIAPNLYTTFNKKLGRSIIITQPRILTAIDKAQDMVKVHKNLVMGLNVGYQTGARSYKPREHGIISMTTGILLNILSTSKNIELVKKYSFIMIDEIHEKDINVDTILFMIKKFLKDCWEMIDCPIFIFMSATFDPEPYLKYFDIPRSNFIEVEGRTFPIADHFPQYDVNNCIMYAFNLATRLHVENLDDLKTGNDISRDIIVFVKNRKDANMIVNLIHTFNSTVMDKGVHYAADYVKSRNDESVEGGSENYYMLPVLLNKHSFSEGGVDYRNVFSEIQYLQVPIYAVDDTGLNIISDKIDKYVQASRKVIVATPVAETGITIKSLKYCIDTGWVLAPEFNPDFGCTVLVSKNVTKSMAYQRKGRVGRLAPGEWYPCYTESTFNAFPEDSLSKYVTENISAVLLSIMVNETGTILADVNIDEPEGDSGPAVLFRKHPTYPNLSKLTHTNSIDFSALDFFESPSAGGLCYSLEKLHVLGLLDFNCMPTLLGYLISHIRKIEIEPMRMIFAGYQHGANILDLITVAAFLQVERRNVCGRNYKFRNPANLGDAASEFYNRAFIADEFIDCIFLWNDFTSEVHKLEKMITTEDGDKFSVDHIKEWCHANDIDHEGFLYVISTRDEIIESMLSVGVNPYYNGLNLAQGTYNITNIFKSSLEEGIEEVKKIKRCILDGYRCNVARWNQSANSYEMMHRHTKVKVRSKLVSEIDAAQPRPQLIILSGVILQPNFNSVTYSFNNSGSVSVLDGFIDLDLNFLHK